MFKARETKKLLNEWRSFINESTSGVNTTRVDRDPKWSIKKAAKDLRDELNRIYGNNKSKDIFYCYDFFDQHGDETMIDPNDGYQIEIEAMTKHIAGKHGFPNNIDLSNIVMTEDTNLDDAGLSGIGVNKLGEFDVPWPTGNYQGTPNPYYYGEIDINNRFTLQRKQKVVYKNEGGYTVYYLWPDSSLGTPSKQFDDEIDDKDDEVLGMFS